MDEKTADLRFILNADSTLYRLDNQILSNCIEFDCGVSDLNDFFKNDAMAYESDLMGKTYCWLDNRDDKEIVAMILVDAINEEHTLRFYERNGFKPLFPRIDNEKDFYDIKPEENLRTRMYYFDLLD